MSQYNTKPVARATGDIEIVRRKSVSYTENGYAGASDESYIKISTSFRDGTLRQLQGAPLSAFLDVALHEADEPPGVTLDVISDETGVSYRHLLRIMPQLCKDAYCVIAGADRRGNQIYRVAAYAWFGKEKPPAPQAAPPRVQKACDKMSHDNGVPLVVDVDVRNSTQASRQQTNNKQAPEVRKLLQACGIFGKPLQSLSQVVSLETAQDWQTWFEHAPATIRNPAGVIVNALLADHEAPAPVIRPKEEPRKRKPTIQGKLAPRPKEEPC